MTVIFLVFIDPDECDRVLEGRLEGDGEVYEADMGEVPGWWEDEEPDAVAS